MIGRTLSRCYKLSMNRSEALALATGLRGVPDSYFQGSSCYRREVNGAVETAATKRKHIALDCDRRTRTRGLAMLAGGFTR